MPKNILKSQYQISFIVILGFFALIMLPVTIEAADHALSFDGDDIVVVPHNDNLNFGLNDFSIESWVKTTESNADIIAKFSYPLGWGLYGDYLGSAGGYFSDGTNEIQLAGNTSIIDNVWHNIIIVKENTSLKMYIDGNLENTETWTIGGVDNNTNLTFGGGELASPPFFVGPIDELRIYSRALSPTEVLEHYNGTFSNEAGLVGLWHFDEGSGNIATDSSSQQNNGVIDGATWVEGRRYLPPSPPTVLGYAFRPEIEIESPKGEDSFSELIEIRYRATDQNNIVGPSEFALGDDAVSIFYSADGGASWILLVEDLSPVGSYQWNTKDLDEGDFYKIKVVAQDKSQEKDEEILTPVIIDKTPPLFDVSVEPPFSKGENVMIRVQATEPLLEPPEVIVTQRNYVDIRVPVSGEKALWEGNYEIKPAADGTAKITVMGKDMAGNKSNIIRKGGFFNVGINPPPTPIITSPLNNDIFVTSTISIVGNIREDTKAILFLNNERIQEVIPDPEGNFVIKDIKLSQIFNKGINILKIISEDKSGNLSEPVSLSIKFNVLPLLEITAPRAGDILFGTSTIEIFATDGNGDKLTFSIESSLNNGKSWQELIASLKERSFIWVTHEFPDGEYILRVRASDGFGETFVLSEKFSLRNVLPVISLEKERIIINKDSINIKGSVKLPFEIYRGVKKNLTNVEYSLSQGETWLTAQAKDGSFDSISEEFIISLNNLKEGLYEIFVRAKDTKGFIGKGKMILIVDFGPPPLPVTTLPKAREVFGEKEDLYSDKAGVQLKIKGTAEPDNQVIAIIGPLTFEGLSDSEGNFDMEATLREHGENVLKIYAIDPAGNKSKEETILQVFKNNPPDLKFLWPRIGGGINHLAEIIFEIQDRDLDPIKESKLSYRRLDTETKIVLAKNLKGNTFSWEVSDFEEGGYELTLEANDGISKNTITREFIIDNTPPEVSFEPLEKSAFTQSFILEMRGSARDNFSGIEYVEYSIDGKNWFKALITSGYKKNEASFLVKHPFELEDGTYYLTFRATDVSGNVSKIREGQKIIIDTTPPRIGSYTLSVGTLLLLPEGEAFRVLNDTKTKFVISLEQDTEKATLLVDSEEIELVKKLGLWEAEIIFSGIEKQKILIFAEDFLGNKTTSREIGTVEVIRRGKVSSLEGNLIEGVKMSIFLFDEETQSWLRWQAEAYDLLNPILTEQNGDYALLLPPGKYQILLQKTGFKRLRSSSFDVFNPQFITFDFKLEPREGVRGFFEDLLEKITF